MPQLFRNRLRLIVLGVAVLFVLPVNVVAIPLNEYQKNLKTAHESLEKLYEMDEEDTEYVATFSKTIEEIRVLLPAEVRIESGSEVYTVNNGPIHDDLTNLEKADDQTESMRLLLEKLKALEERVTERVSATASGESKGWAKSRMEGILARPEYTSGARGPNALSQLVQDIVRWFQSLFPKRQPMDPGRAISVSRIVQIVIVALAALLLLYVLSLFLRRFKRTKKYKAPKTREARIVLGERLEPDQTSTNLLSEAEALAKRGELRAAIRKGYIALLVELGDRKIISLAQHKTNRDYLRGLRDAPQLHSQMRGLTDSFERHWYGVAEANENDWQQFRAGYLETLQTSK